MIFQLPQHKAQRSFYGFIATFKEWFKNCYCTLATDATVSSWFLKLCYNDITLRFFFQAPKRSQLFFPNGSVKHKN